MKQQCSARLIDWPASAQCARLGNGYLLKIAGICEDSLPLEWATQVSRRAIQVVGPRCVCSAHWSVGALQQPGVMQDATEAAIEADILVVSVGGAEELPPNLNRWIDSWLPRRLQRSGALVAVIGVPRQPSAFPARIQDYLHDVASLAHLDFLPQERMLPLGHPGFRNEAFTERQRGARGSSARAATTVLLLVRGLPATATPREHPAQPSAH